jgi:hypothetical protein
MEGGDDPLKGDTRSSKRVKNPKQGTNVSRFRGEAQQAPSSLGARVQSQR